MTAPTTLDPAAEHLAEYPDLVVEDLYSAAGSAAYEAIAGRDRLEVRELVALAAQTRGAILDVAAGAGRLTLPLLTLRRPVTALDLSAPMLEILRTKLDRLPEATRARCSLVEADMTVFELTGDFGAVVLGTTSISLLPDADARIRAFSRIREHLSPGGRVFVTTVDVSGPEREPIRLCDGDTDYTIFEWRRPNLGRRTMTVLAEQRGAVSAFTSTVAILPVEVLVNEMTAAGLRVVETVEAATGEAHYSDTIIAAASAEDADA